MSFLAELKRRNVIRVAVAYLAGAWLLVEVADTLFSIYGLPESAARVVVTILAIGFPITLVLSWIYELTPEGLKLEKDVDRSVPLPRSDTRRLDRVIIVLLALALGYFAFDKFVLEPARVVEIVEETAQQARSQALVESYGDKSIAVLPFVNMSADPEQEYFSDGISEELLNLLAQIPELRVISRSSAFSFKDKHIPIPEVARQLHVEHVLEGSIRKAGDRVRITAKLIEARSDTQLWSEVYDRKRGDIFTIQEEIARAIGSALEPRLVKSVTTAVQPRRVATTNTAAYEAYLKGRYHLNKWGVEGFTKSLEYFQQALDKDPDYAPAHAGLAMSYQYLGLFGILPPNEACPKSKEIVMQALELDDTLAEAHTSLADVMFFYDWNWEGAEREYKRAIELNPNYSIAHNNYAFFFVALTQHEEALTRIKRARELDPVSLMVNSDLGWAYYFARQYDQAISQFQQALELDPSLAISQFALGHVYAQKKMFVESVAAFQKAISLSPSDPVNLAGLGYAYAVSGRREDALAIISKLEQPSQRGPVPSWAIALIHVGLGNKNEAFFWLWKAFENHSSDLVYIKTDPVLDPIRSDLRFQVLIRRMGFPE